MTLSLMLQPSVLGCGESGREAGGGLIDRRKKKHDFSLSVLE